MKMKVVRTLIAAAAAILLASCGGGGGDDSPPPQPSLQLSGTAATGAALTGATVEVKCASGTGTATTTATGTYTVSIPEGALPCAVQVTASGGADALVLHSVVEAGSTDDATAVTTAKANVTPLTELVVAQLAATLPTEFFGSFGTASAGLLTPEKVSAASTAVATSLQAVGVDLAGIDPLKADLQAATDTSAGNNYDQLLDALAEKVTPETLPLLVTQVANAAATGSSSALTDAMTAVEGGGLPGCPYVLSGNYRAIDYTGRMTLRPINFAAKTFGAGDGVNQMTLVQDTTNPCAFTATLTTGGQTGEWQVAFGPGGVGIYRARFTAPAVTPGVTGTIFPVQSHDYSEVVGTYTYLNTGSFPSIGVQHHRGQVTFGADRTDASCDYIPTSDWACEPEADRTVVDRSDGGFDTVADGVTRTTMYAYRTPSGAVNLFGTTNPGGSTDPAVNQSSLFLVKLDPLTLPEVGSVGKYSETLILFSSAINGTRSTDPITSNQVTNIAVDAAANTVTRRRESDGRIDTWHLNTPIPGLRTRDAGTTNGVAFSAAYQMNIPGTGIALTTNAAGAFGRFFASSVTRP